MTITLTSEQMEWLEAHVEAGEFASVEEAVRQLLDERIDARFLEEIGDLAWAKPLIDEALADVEQGRVIALEDHLGAGAAFLRILDRR